MKTGFKYEYAEVLNNCFKKYYLFITDDGEFVDSVTKKKLNKNHVRCMLRNDYLNSGHGQLSGSMLCAIIDRYLLGVMKAAKTLTDAGDSMYTGEMEVMEDFLK